MSMPLSNLDLILVLSLLVLAFMSFCTFVVLVPLALQLSRTLSSLQHLTNTVKDDFEPSLKEIKQSVDKVNSLVKSGSGYMKFTFDNAGFFIISSAYGMLAGVKDYLASYRDGDKGENTSYNGKDGKGKKEETIGR